MAQAGDGRSHDAWFPSDLAGLLKRRAHEICPWDYDQRGFEQTEDIFRASIWSVGVNYLSLPAGLAPIGLIEGLPAGVQVIGQRYREDLILDALEAIEQRVGVLVHQLWAREAEAAAD